MKSLIAVFLLFFCLNSLAGSVPLHPQAPNFRWNLEERKLEVLTQNGNSSWMTYDPKDRELQKNATIQGQITFLVINGILQIQNNQFVLSDSRQVNPTPQSAQKQPAQAQRSRTASGPALLQVPVFIGPVGIPVVYPGFQIGQLPQQQLMALNLNAVPAQHWCLNKDPKFEQQRVGFSHAGYPLYGYYTRDYQVKGGAYSDHAPVLYEKNLIGTWNIAQKAEMFQLPNGEESPNHKFINLEGSSESLEQYLGRLNRVTKAIAQIFQSGRTRWFAVQELPFAHFSPRAQTPYISDLLRAHRLKILADGGQGIIVADFNRSEFIAVDEKQREAIKEAANLEDRIGDKAIKKMAAYFDPDQAAVIVSVHLPWGLNGAEIYRLLKEYVHNLRLGYLSQLQVQYPNRTIPVYFTGDFNFPGSELQKAMIENEADLAYLSRIQIQTTPNEKAHSAGPDGDNPKNIDLLVKFN